MRWGVDDPVAVETYPQKQRKPFEETGGKFDIATPFVLVNETLKSLPIRVDCKKGNPSFLPSKKGWFQR
jgi:hypothetical protein